jgi:hypothetical protein
MKAGITLTSAEAPGLVLRSIEAGDQELLRAWKNANRQFFFFQQVIEPEMQRRWFAGYEQRPDDHMFMVMVDGVPAGCMAVRLLEDGTLDVYNVILGDEAFKGSGTMSRALRLMSGFALARYAAPLRLKVLKENPAVGWYLRNGFRRIGDGGDHLELELAETHTTQEA